MRRQPGNMEFGKRRPERRNLLYNGCMRVAQRGTSFTAATTPANSDDTYLLDRWILLSDGIDRVDISQETTDVPAGHYAAMKFLGATLTPGEKFGVLQVLESRDSAQLAGAIATLSFYAHTTTGDVENLRAAIISWDGAADAVTSDVVSAWAVEGTNPTLAANWAFENTPVDLVLSNSYQRFVIPGIPVDTAGMTNVGVFIWVDDTDVVAADELFIGGIQLEHGGYASDFHFRPFSEELALCQRYYAKTFDYGVAPAQNTGDNDGAVAVGGAGTNATWNGMNWEYPVAMRTDPSVTRYNPQAVDTDWEELAGGVGDRGSDMDAIGEARAFIGFTQAPGAGGLYIIHASADAEL